MWQRFDNATTTGLATLTSVFGQDPTTLFRDWAVFELPGRSRCEQRPALPQASWNLRSIFANTYVNIPVYPLKTTLLADQVKSDFQIRGGSAAYVRFSALAGREALLTLTSGGARRAPRSSLCW